MKKLFILFALLLPLTVNAQMKGFKRVETFPKDKPSWVGYGSLKGYILTQTEGGTLDEAKSKAMDAVRAEMASSVATEIQRTISVESTIMRDDEGSKHGSESHIVTESKIAKMPAIQGVSIANCDIYYELYRNKKTKEELYKVYAKYPFSLLDLDNLVEAYNENESRINNEIDSYRAKLDSITEIEDISNAVTNLKLLSKSLDSDDSRISVIDKIINDYNKIYKNINIDVIENRSGIIKFNLRYAGRNITTTQKPDISSNCASQFSIKMSGDSYVIMYNNKYCYENDENFITIKFKFGTKFVTEQVYF